MTALLTRPDLLRALADVSVSPDRCSATVAGAALTTESPRQLTAELGAALYGFLHSGQGAVPPSFVQRRRDLPFEEELRAGLPHRRISVPAELLRPDDGDGTVLVGWSGLRLRVPSGLTDRRGELLRLQLPAGRPALSPGFFFVEGSRQPSRRSELLRVYVHLDAAEHAPAVWTAVLSHLEDRALPYQAKVLSDRVLYPRRDALVVYLPRESWSGLAPLAAALADSAGIGPATSLLAHPVGPGVAIAAEPSDPRPGWNGMSFGQHRCAALAEALLAAAAGDGPLETAVARSFAAAGIDPGRPARNTSSSDFPVDEPTTAERR